MSPSGHLQIAKCQKQIGQCSRCASYSLFSLLLFSISLPPLSFCPNHNHTPIQCQAFFSPYLHFFVLCKPSTNYLQLFPPFNIFLPHLSWNSLTIPFYVVYHRWQWIFKETTMAGQRVRHKACPSCHTVYDVQDFFVCPFCYHREDAAPTNWSDYWQSHRQKYRRLGFGACFMSRKKNGLC